ncbi:unnamed protein product [Candida verbasci]|uniref:Succinate dehydrogenase assembly factor 4, mitochondrial n=1 Tax=Candida verbasci TaxID=1227364 RepID=A0A9W4TUB5_9ASCO|nr:unnamed protein product [Candida verbasci]
MLSRFSIRSINRSIIYGSFRFYSPPPSKFDFQPGPPKLPKEQQEEFENLQHIAQTQIVIDEFNDKLAEANREEPNNTNAPNLSKDNDIGNFAYFKTIPEFEGDVNPKTGERGGPKQDPLKHGDNEWTFNGRVIDF